jgi:multisubunit Na+/H+ antiporter MnhB subunit
MTMAFVFDIGLVALLLAVATWSMVARQAFTAVVAFVVYGFLMAIVWVELSAVDVALTEVAIGSGLTGALLLGAVARLGRAETLPAVERPSRALRLVAALLSATVATALGAAVLFMRHSPPSLAPAAAANAAATGLSNPVANVLMAFRAMDTLLEKVVLLIALVGVWSLTPNHLWGGRPGPRYWADPYGVLAFLARVLPPIGVIVGIYMVWAGANRPGGAFQSGTILAAMWLLVMRAGVAHLPPINRPWLHWLLIAGPAGFLLVGLGGLWLGDAFLAYPVAYAKPIIVAIEVPMTLTIAVTLVLLMSGVPEGSADR